MKASWRLLKALLHLLRGYWIIRTQFAKISQQKREAHVQRWSVQLLGIMGVKLQVLGKPMAYGMLVANHISWMDNVAIHAAHFCRFVAKSDIKAWPVMGYLTDQSGMLFIERTSRRDARRVVEFVAQQLAAGDCIAVFPEGTTGDGRGLLPFHANMLQSAIEANALVQPVCICYTDSVSGEQSLAPNFVGDDTLLQSVWRTLSAKSITVVLQFGEPQLPQGRERRDFAHDLRSSIHTMLSKRTLS